MVFFYFKTTDKSHILNHFFYRLDILKKTSRLIILYYYGFGISFQGGPKLFWSVTALKK